MQSVAKSVQGLPTPPMGGVTFRQVPPLQVPWLQTFEAQHGWLMPPHAVQLFDWQTV